MPGLSSLVRVGLKLAPVLEQVLVGHVAHHARRHAHDDLARRHVARDDGAGGDERLLADLSTAPPPMRHARRSFAPRSGTLRSSRPILSSFVVIAHGPTNTSSSTTL